jgi:DNA-binding transcriptional LysR family regulator
MAAHRLGLSPAAISRAISGLEKQLGVELLQRTTRHVRLTEAGKRYLVDVKNVVMSIAEANDAATASPKGNLVITASELFGRFFVLPCIAEYLNRFPEVEVLARFYDRVVDLADEDVDVAIRIGDLTDPGLRSACVGRVRRVVCAAPDYLDRRGIPQHPSDLAHHLVISANTERLSSPEWQFDAAHGRTAVSVQPNLTVTSDAAAIAAAVCGLGLAHVLSFQVAAHVADGTLKIVLGKYDKAARPVYVLWREKNWEAPKVWHFVTRLVERLRASKELS